MRKDLVDTPPEHHITAEEQGDAVVRAPGASAHLIAVPSESPARRCRG